MDPSKLASVCASIAKAQPSKELGDKLDAARTRYTAVGPQQMVLLMQAPSLHATGQTP